MATVGGICSPFAILETHEESLFYAGLEIGWRLLVSAIILNGLFCHISPGLMVYLQSNPWTTQLNWFFGIKAQNYQALNLVIYHQSAWGRLTHWPTLTADFLAWIFVIGYGLGRETQLVVLCLVVIQALSTKFKPLVIVTCLFACGSFTLAWWSTLLSLEHQVTIYRCAQVTILSGGAVRLLGHMFEMKVPPRPNLRHECELLLFEEYPNRVLTAHNIASTTVGLIAEASAGLPLRLFLPMLNILIGSMTVTDNQRPQGLDSFSTLQASSREILAKGWSIGNPSCAELISAAVKLETAPERLPDALLPPKWHAFFVVESFSVLGLSIARIDFQNPLASILNFGYVWIMLRMLSAKNLDMRSFCFVVEALTLCGLLNVMFIIGEAALSCGGSSFSSTQHSNSRAWIAPFVYSWLVLAMSMIHFFFLSLAVPYLGADLYDDYPRGQRKKGDSIGASQDSLAVRVAKKSSNAVRREAGQAHKRIIMDSYSSDTR